MLRKETSGDKAKKPINVCGYRIANSEKRENNIPSFSLSRAEAKSQAWSRKTYELQQKLTYFARLSQVCVRFFATFFLPHLLLRGRSLCFNRSRRAYTQIHSPLLRRKQHRKEEKITQTTWKKVLRVVWKREKFARSAITMDVKMVV